MTAEDAFDVGRAAWVARRAMYDPSAHTADFDRMIAEVPRDLRQAAIHGWLNAFDDEDDRIRGASRN